MGKSFVRDVLAEMLGGLMAGLIVASILQPAGVSSLSLFSATEAATTFIVFVIVFSIVFFGLFHLLNLKMDKRILALFLCVVLVPIVWGLVIPESYKMFIMGFLSNLAVIFFYFLIRKKL